MTSPGFGGFFGSQRTMTCAPSSIELANFTVASFGLPYTKASAPSSSTTSTVTWKPVDAGTNASGRTPTVTVEPALPGRSIAKSPSIALPPETGALRRFIAGEPMKPATKAFAGFS